MSWFQEDASVVGPRPGRPGDHPNCPGTHVTYGMMVPMGPMSGSRQTLRLSLGWSLLLGLPMNEIHMRIPDGESWAIGGDEHCVQCSDMD